MPLLRHRRRPGPGQHLATFVALVAVVAVGSLIAAAVATAAEPPRGKRRPRPKATHVVIVETAFATGGAPATLMAGVPVAATGAVSVAAKKVKVTVLARGVEVTGTVSGAALGQCVQADVPLLAPDGKAALGHLRAGALVRVVGPAPGPAQAKAGLVLVESAGDFTVRGLVPRAALGAAPKELVLTFGWTHETSKVTTLWPTQELKGSGIVRLPEKVKLEAYEQAGDVYHVRALGGVELDGWTPSANLAPREVTGVAPPDAGLVKATHEVFLDAPIYADPAGKKVLGTLRGGALVEVNAKASQSGSAEGDAATKAGMKKVTTPAPVLVPGWMKDADLRELRPAPGLGVGAAAAPK